MKYEETRNISTSWVKKHVTGHTLSWETLRISKSRVRKSDLHSTKRTLTLWVRESSILGLFQTVKRKSAAIQCKQDDGPKC